MGDAVDLISSPKHVMRLLHLQAVVSSQLKPSSCRIERVVQPKGIGGSFNLEVDHPARLLDGRSPREHVRAENVVQRAFLATINAWGNTDCFLSFYTAIRHFPTVRPRFSVFFNFQIC